jgi:hypothetical protein
VEEVLEAGRSVAIKTGSTPSWKYGSTAVAASSVVGAGREVMLGRM